ncbi:hypothetical protein L486_08025 [Kwoniella mangroviensis CBS 10435]|uniref:Uncharacterized protein n=1 Tax=Kwoniella mangroviensis CBS 10435 TaxID=1331196 RepID=A0A1B9IGA1_9TREE|nr:hypothetical protein L486_08025 [Kwoniella mangroviensis CBS 10435]
MMEKSETRVTNPVVADQISNFVLTSTLDGLCFDRGRLLCTVIGIIFSILDLSDSYYCYSQNHIKDWFDYDEHIYLLRNSRDFRRAVNIQDEEIHGNDVTSPSILINEITAPASEQKQEITPVEQLHPEAENYKPNEVKSQEQLNSQGGARGWVKNSGKVAFFAITGLVIPVPTLVAVRFWEHWGSRP